MDKILIHIYGIQFSNNVNLLARFLLYQLMQIFNAMHGISLQKRPHSSVYIKEYTRVCY